ncbi:MAG: hypothetical protein ACYC3I_19905, partial [Gemmataceae bacterium]
TIIATLILLNGHGRIKRCIVGSLNMLLEFSAGFRADDTSANARRICAAVNACEGISTEALEHGIVQELLERIRTVAELRRKWRSQDEAETIDSIEYMDGLDALEPDDLIARATGRAA